MIGVGTASFCFLTTVMLAISAHLISPTAFDPQATAGSLLSSGLPGPNLRT